MTATDPRVRSAVLQESPRSEGHASHTAPMTTPVRTVMPAVGASPVVQAHRPAPNASRVKTPRAVRVWSMGARYPLLRNGLPHLHSGVMPIDIDIGHVARLARLDLDTEDMELYRRQLGVILEHAARVQALDTTSVEPTAHPLGFTNAFRPDEVRPSLDRDEVLAQAPEARDGYFVAPPALDQE